MLFPTPDDWRAWLQEHHSREKEAWVVIRKKHAAIPGVTLAEATEEALCFGWIDSNMRPIDGETYALRYSPRRPRSNWSERNKTLAAKLIEQGRMTDAGLAKIDEAKHSGGWR